MGLYDDLLRRDAKQLGSHVNFLIDIQAGNYEEDPWLRWKSWHMCEDKIGDIWWRYPDSLILSLYI